MGPPCNMYTLGNRSVWSVEALYLYAQVQKDSTLFISVGNLRTITRKEMVKLGVVYHKSVTALQHLRPISFRYDGI